MVRACACLLGKKKEEEESFGEDVIIQCAIFFPTAAMPDAGRRLVFLTMLAAGAVAQTRAPFRPAAVEKSVVNYLGNNFLLLDGCPEPECGGNDDDNCAQTVATIRNLYSACLQSPDGQHLGCITNRLSDREVITLPKYIYHYGVVINLSYYRYATTCAAMCYESDPASLAEIKPCPHAGYRQHHPSLEELF